MLEEGGSIGRVRVGVVGVGGRRTRERGAGKTWWLWEWLAQSG